MQSRVSQVGGVAQALRMLWLEDHVLRAMCSTSWTRDPKAQWLQQQRTVAALSLSSLTVRSPWLVPMLSPSLVSFNGRDCDIFLPQLCASQ